jgi:trehalose 6-phosphate phosphatase
MGAGSDLSDQPRSTAELSLPPAIDRGRDALFLDLDGTITPIRPRPDQVEIDARVNRALRQLSQRLGGRLAVVSGREIAEIDRLTGGIAPAAAGVHGLDLRLGTRRMTAAPAAGVVSAAAEFRALAATDPGLLVEDKGLSTTLHYRQVPELEAEARALAERLAAEHGLVLQTGKMVVELRTPGGDKGAAVETLMQEAPFLGSRPWFVGDDDTDEAGFAAAARLGGAGVLVGPPRPTAAHFRLPDVEAVADWLGAGIGEEAVR